MDWKPVASPYAQTKKAAYNLAIKIRAALILLLSAWHMKPSHFRSETNSIYKNLGWWLPLVPGLAYAWAAQSVFASSITEALPDFPIYFLFFGNMALVTVMAYTSASISYGSHFLVCYAGRAFKLRESPPSYEFFLFAPVERGCGSLLQSASW